MKLILFFFFFFFQAEDGIRDYKVTGVQTCALPIYLHDARAFPKEVEIWDRTGKVLHKLASLPLEDRVPINGVMTGPRSIQWRPNDPATLLWVDALDKGDLKNKVPNRDRLLSLKAPFTGEPGEIAKTG